MGLVTLDVAKEHLRPPGNADDGRIERLINQASGIVLDYLKLDSDAYMNTSGTPEETVPYAVEAAVLLVLGALYDNTDGQDKDKQPLSDAVKALLHTRRTPTVR